MDPQTVGFTWWGGFIGPKLINQVECPNCGGRYNGRTGRSNDTAIAIYLVVLGVLAFGVTFLVALGGR